MKDIAIAAIILLSSSQLLAQANLPPNTVVQSFAFTPSKRHLDVRGIAVGGSTTPWILADTLYVHVHGFNLELGPLGMVLGIWGTAFGFAGVRDEKHRRTGFFSRHGYIPARYTQIPQFGTHVHGVSISIGGLTDAYTKGLIINGVSGMCYNTSGVQISGLINSAYQSKGVSIAGLVNQSTRAKGLQIGLINTCRTGNVVQIGLFNRIGNRIVPFVNLRFGKEPDLGEEYARRNRKDRIRRTAM